MPDIDIVRDWRGRTMVDRDGDKLGTITDIYLDEDTGQPEWALVNTGLFGTKSTFVPLAQAQAAGDSVRVPYQTAKVKDAPTMDAEGHLSQDEEAELYRYYGLDYTESRSDSGLPAGTTGRGRDTGGPVGDEAMTRSEEELRVGTTRQERGRVRLRKWVETEQVTQTVPVAREEARVEREPITDANVEQAMAGPDITEAEHEVVLEEERPVVDKQAVPKERVRLDKDVVTDEERVSEEVRRERVEVEGADDPGRDDRR